MRNFQTVFLLMVVLSTGCAGQGTDDVTTFILVRHAEKGNDGTQDPDLTDEGRARAQKLSFMFKDTPLTAIYSTNYKRTKNTVKPVADAHKVDVAVYETFKPEVIEEMVKKHRGGTILVSGHTNTIPWTANLLMGKQSFKDYPETEYGIVLVIAVNGVGKPVSVTRFNY